MTEEQLELFSMRREIVHIPKKVLTTPASIVPEGEDVSKLAEEMYETMCRNNGIGLAAPQVGIPKQVFVWGSRVAINPVLHIDHRAFETREEGCLSIPGIRYPVRRATSVRLEAYDLSWKPFSIDAVGLQARMFQHEMDHLNGILINKKK